EFLSSLKPLPDFTAATEGWLPNVPVASQRLAPLGITVKHYEDDHHLPFEDETFDLVINRHESFAAAEIHRIIQDGGIFITQQVADGDNAGLNLALDAPPDDDKNALFAAVREFSQAGFVILRAEEASLLTEFYDIGAVVYYLKIITWQIPDFDVESYRDRLLKLHEQIEREGKFVCHNRRFLLVARKETV
ncbi:MAG: SAM-dependent methyltransferase, partial [Chloroflexi bacterium]|nr:SAM-dependent methyltransferase [Chloroflexota bacterium]